MLALLRHRNFALLWWGGLISLTGNRVLSVALPFYVYKETGSTLATAAMVIATIVPSMLFSSVAGVFVDRWNRKRVMVISNFLLAIVLLPLLIVSMTGWLWLVYLVAFLETTLSTFFRSAENALLPQVVTKDQLVPANSLNALNDTLARLIGPALGGILLAAGSLEVVVIVDSLSYALAGLLTYFVNAPSSQICASSERPELPLSSWLKFRSEWVEGFAVIRRHRVLALLLVVMGVTTLGGTMQDPLIAPFVYEVLSGNAAQFGWMLSVQGLGGVVGGLLVGSWARQIKATSLFGFSCIVVGLLLFVLYQSTSINVAIVLAFAVGLASVGSRVGSQTLLQENTEDAYRGRFFGTLSMTGSTLELFSVSFAGLMAEQLGIVPILSVAASITVVAGVLALLLIKNASLAKDHR
jgi:MFS family permease